MKKKKPIKIEVEIKFLPFPSEEARKEAYYTHAKLFLRAKKRILKKARKEIKKHINSRNNL